MKIVKGILITLFVLAAIIAIGGFLSPRMMHIERSIAINASSENVHDQINDLHKWNKWSPWHEMDTAMVLEYFGSESGAGAGYKWKSEKVGSGDLTITSSTQDSINSALNMDYGPANIKFELSISDSGTKVTWIMEADNGMNPIPRFMCLFMKGMMEKDFDKGLINLKKLAEAIPTGPKRYRGYEVMEMDSPEMVYVGKKDSIGWDKIAEFYMKTLPTLGEAITKAKVEMTGAPTGLYFIWDTVNKTTVMAAVIGVKGNAKTKVKGLETFVIPAGKILRIAYYGGYNGIGAAHNAMQDYIDEKAFLKRLPISEEYISDPGKEPDSTKWLTNVYYPVK